MHAEWISIPEGLPETVAAARQAGGRIIAVGTTVVRALEGSAGEDGAVLPGGRSCELFIGPGHRFRVVDGLITNFHLPRSTLLVLVCAFAGRERILAAYAEAVSRGYRFYSYGDAMAIL
jgi:S-adenosylmethionine:tRNA ribosyltransferase-isomerase